MVDNLNLLDLRTLSDAVAGAAVAIRLRLELQPAGGKGAKVFPPTYQGGIYATEKRNVDGKEVPCALLDSVQSQANRLEQALLAAYRAGKLKFPLLCVDFSQHFPDIGEVTALDAPHRIADAIFRDSTLGGKPFRPQPRAGSKRDTSEISEEGRRFSEATVRNATPLLELCPTALIFGVWDSTGAAGGLGNKFARAIASEIVGINAVVGVRTSSRIDPTGIEKGDVYEDANGFYVVDASKARKEEGKPVVFKRKKADKGRPSEINHGNVTPDLVRSEDGKELIGGGVTIDHAEQITVLSLAALRRLRFPVDGQSTPEGDRAARVLLAALALAAVAHQIDPPDYFLRSNCQLVPPTSEPIFELVVSGDRIDHFRLGADLADQLFAQSVAAVKESKLPWREEKIILEPRPALLDLIRRSRELGSEEG